MVKRNYAQVTTWRAQRCFSPFSALGLSELGRNGNNPSSLQVSTSPPLSSGKKEKKLSCPTSYDRLDSKWPALRYTVFVHPSFCDCLTLDNQIMESLFTYCEAPFLVERRANLPLSAIEVLKEESWRMVMGCFSHYLLVSFNHQQLESICFYSYWELHGFGVVWETEGVSPSH